MRKLTKKELKATKALVRALSENGISFEAAAEIVGMRLTYLGAFSIPNIERVFDIRE